MGIPKKSFYHLTEKDRTIITVLLHANYSISEIRLQKHRIRFIMKYNVMGVCVSIMK